VTTPATPGRDSVQRIEDVEEFLGRCGYVGDREIATALFLAIRLRRPLLVEGYAGVGKTEIAKTLAEALATRLYRLQCYEGLDASAALYEWNYAKQILRIRMEEQSSHTALEKESTIFSEPYLLSRPLLQALRNGDQSAVLLVDEIDRADEEFEAFLLEMLSEYQVTIPELGVIRAQHPPYVVLTSNRVRELGDALKRRCLYLWIGYPPLEKEVRIIQNRVPGIEQSLARQISLFVEALRELDLDKRPGVAESIDWSMALLELHSDHLTVETARATLGCLVKSKRDVERVQRELPELTARVLAG
jgi:MoxR-like ATPase